MTCSNPEFFFFLWKKQIFIKSTVSFIFKSGSPPLRTSNDRINPTVANFRANVQHSLAAVSTLIAFVGCAEFVWLDVAPRGSIRTYSLFSRRAETLSTAPPCRFIEYSTKQWECFLLMTWPLFSLNFEQRRLNLHFGLSEF